MVVVHFEIESLTPIVVTVVALLLVYEVLYWNWPDGEKAIDYDVPLPEQCKPGWTGEQLKDPSLKVRRVQFV